MSISNGIAGFLFYSHTLKDGRIYRHYKQIKHGWIEALYKKRYNPNINHTHIQRNDPSMTAQ